MHPVSLPLTPVQWTLPSLASHKELVFWLSMSCSESGGMAGVGGNGGMAWEMSGDLAWN